MIALIDTNVVLDVLLNRTEHLEHSTSVLESLRDGKYRGFVAATTLTNIFYIVRKLAGKQAAMKAVNKIMEMFEVVPVNRKVLDEARSGERVDFEDAVQASAAKDYGLEIVVTRDKKDSVTAACM